ncbi:hypothetical protein J3458_021315 [Metarhizium acridum]|uniref:uncharacterized protein n=1 Tax=Metarhizium acridum TaxID=92637 RepID=UPI001C6AAAA2|nr:hypothetical protein J3458_021315 [Metarhizium acridum]
MRARKDSTSRAWHIDLQIPWHQDITDCDLLYKAALPSYLLNIFYRPPSLWPCHAAKLCPGILSGWIIAVHSPTNRCPNISPATATAYSRRESYKHKSAWVQDAPTADSVHRIPGPREG